MMAKKKFNPYEELDVPVDASADEIKAARKRRVRKAHPDVGGSAEEFNRVQTASLILLNPERRRRYDRDGTVEDEKPVDTMRNQAVELIFNHVASAVDEYVAAGMKGRDPRKRKLLVEYCQQAHIKIVEMEAQVQLGTRVEAYYRDMASRFTSEKDKSNVLRRQMENCAHKTLKLIDELKEQIAKVKMSIEICGMYDFRFDPEEFGVHVHHTVFTTTTTGTRII
jgi:curved DNA-binding protein CbpA